METSAGNAAEAPRKRSSAAARRRTRQREDTRRAILEATDALLDESASDDFSIRQLSERCGYTAPTIYNYFADKDSLIDALLEERFAKLVDELERLPTRGVDPLDLLRTHAVLFVRFGRENPSFYRLLLGRRPRPASARPPPPSAEKVRVLMQAPMMDLSAGARLLLPLDVSHQSLWALTHGLTTLSINRPDFEWNPKLVENAVDVMLRGLIRPATADVIPENER